MKTRGRSVGDSREMIGKNAREGGEVGDAVVDGDAGGEGDAFDNV